MANVAMASTSYPPGPTLHLEGGCELDPGSPKRLVDRERPNDGAISSWIVWPVVVELWAQGEDRLHDRVRYRRERERWVTERLLP